MDYREQFLALALTLSEQEKDFIIQILEALVAEVDILEVGEK